MKILMMLFSKLSLFTIASLSYVTSTVNNKNDTSEIIEHISKFDQLSQDSFDNIMRPFNPREVLDFKILNIETYRKVRNLWPRLEAFTFVFHNIFGELTTDNPMEFSHRTLITGVKNFSYSRAQLSCIKDFTFRQAEIYNLQTIIDFLPKRWLTSLKLQINVASFPLIHNFYFPNLEILDLRGPAIKLSPNAFSCLSPDLVHLVLENIQINDAACVLLARVLQSMTRLKTLSLGKCYLSQLGLSSILENLPASLTRLSIASNDFLPGECTYDQNLFTKSLEKLESMIFLEDIYFCEVNVGLRADIISHLPPTIRCAVGTGFERIKRQNSNKIN